MYSDDLPLTPEQQTRQHRLKREVLIVLALSLGQSAVWAVWRLVNNYLKEAPLAQQTTQLNPSRSTVQIMDAIHQVLEIGFFSLVPVALAVFLLNADGGRVRERLGLVWKRSGPASPWRDLRNGVLLAAAIGIPGIGVYVIGRALGQSLRIDTNGLPDAWWAATVLILSALAAAILEETIVVGYLMTRLGEIGWRVPAAIAASAVLRGSYHLYQGWPMAVGNMAMGVAFALVFLKTRRLGPLLVAHTIFDLVTFIGPEIVPASWLAALHLA